MNDKATAIKRPELAVSIERVFKSAPYFALRRIRCEIKGDTCVLKGQVPSYFLKQLAQTNVVPLLETHRLVNELEVIRWAGT